MGFLDYILRPDFILFLVALIIILILSYLKWSRSGRSHDKSVVVREGSWDWEKLKQSQRETSSVEAPPQMDEVMPKAKGIDLQFSMRVLVSLVILAAALFIILKGTHSKASHEWAFGAIGLIIGYWLK